VFSVLVFLVYFLSTVFPLGEFWGVIVQVPFFALSAMIFYKATATEKAKEFSNKKCFFFKHLW
jgi:hypothetical protein